jgi:hypothetical protein
MVSMLISHFVGTIMARFAWDCLVKIGETTKELEVTLGPEINDLSMRFGLHSGSVIEHDSNSLEILSIQLPGWRRPV